MNLLLFNGQMPDALKTQIVAAVTSRSIPAAVAGTGSTPTNQASIDAAKRDRVNIAVLLSLASPDYLIQK